VLEEVRENYPMSFHGVGLSLGTSGQLDEVHLKKLKRLVDRFNPALVSDHISWSNLDNITVLNDLLPVPYTNEVAKKIISNIKQTQDYLGRQILVENPSTYLEFTDSKMPEYEFICKVIEGSECGLLLDINNIYVNSENHNLDPYEYLKNIPGDAIQEIHLAGHARKEIEDKVILLDNHGSRVIPPVWDLYETAIQRFGKIPTLIEWDMDIPDFSILTEEAKLAQDIMDREIATHAAA